MDRADQARRVRLVTDRPDIEADILGLEGDAGARDRELADARLAKAAADHQPLDAPPRFQLDEPGDDARKPAGEILGGAEWAKTRRLLLRRESFTFLDQVHERLAGLGLDPDVLSALLDLEGLRRQPWRRSAATRSWALVRTVQLAKACPDWSDEAGRVRAVLRGVWRASSLVECINSVLRMQQARHRRLTQGLLDLKRLYWNCHTFRTGRRRGTTPYQRLGISWPEGLRWWDVLKLTPEQLRDKLSTTIKAA